MRSLYSSKSRNSAAYCSACFRAISSGRPSLYGSYLASSSRYLPSSAHQRLRGTTSISSSETTTLIPSFRRASNVSRSCGITSSPSSKWPCIP